MHSWICVIRNLIETKASKNMRVSPSWKSEIICQRSGSSIITKCCSLYLNFWYAFSEVELSVDNLLWNMIWKILSIVFTKTFNKQIIVGSRRRISLLVRISSHNTRSSSRTQYQEVASDIANIYKMIYMDIHYQVQSGYIRVWMHRIMSLLIIAYQYDHVIMFDQWNVVTRN